jgi:hypothetical protein
VYDVTAYRSNCDDGDSTVAIEENVYEFSEALLHALRDSDEKQPISAHLATLAAGVPIHFIALHNTDPGQLVKSTHSEGGMNGNSAEPSTDTATYLAWAISLHRADPKVVSSAPAPKKAKHDRRYDEDDAAMNVDVKDYEDEQL